MKFSTFLSISTCAAALLATQGIYAAGFQLKEQGASLQGLSYAGATAKADDLSTMFFNPAGLTRMKGNQADFTVSFIKPSTKLSINSVTPATLNGGGLPVGTDSNGGDAGGIAAVPATYFMWDVSEDVKAGLAINTPFGLSTEYDDGWVGRYYALESALQTINIAPTVAYKVNDQLSVGANVQVQYAHAKLTQAVNYDAAVADGFPDGESKVEGDDIGYGFGFGILYEPTEDTRVGLNYRSRIHHELDGDIRFTNVPAPAAGSPTFANEDATAKIAMPDVLSIGAYHALDEKWAVLADFSWTNWSLFKDLIVQNKSDGAVRQSVPERWKDTFFIALGTEYKPNDKETFQFGVAFDNSPVKDEYRTFRIPDSDRYWISAGYQRDINEKWSLNAGYTYIIAKDSSVSEGDSAADAATKGVIDGTFESSVNILSLGVKYKF